MWQLYQFPLCPFSRKVRLLLAEKGIGYELWRENPWELRDEFARMNPAARTPVIRNDGRDIALCVFASSHQLNTSLPMRNSGRSLAPLPKISIARP